MNSCQITKPLIKIYSWFKGKADYIGFCCLCSKGDSKCTNDDGSDDEEEEDSNDDDDDDLFENPNHRKPTSYVDTDSSEESDENEQ